MTAYALWTFVHTRGVQERTTYNILHEHIPINSAFPCSLSGLPGILTKDAESSHTEEQAEQAEQAEQEEQEGATLDGQ